MLETIIDYPDAHSYVLRDFIKNYNNFDYIETFKLLYSLPVFILYNNGNIIKYGRITEHVDNSDEIKRISFACGDKEFENLEYSFCNVSEWIPELRELKEMVNEEFNANFNMCLIQYYPNGKYTIDLHSDGNNVIDPVCVLSIGSTRNFIFKNNKTGHEIVSTVNHGDLLVMEGSKMQTEWTHGIPESDAPDPRISISFRTFTLDIIKQKIY